MAVIRAALVALALAACSSSSINTPDGTEAADAAASADGYKPVYSVCEVVPAELAFACDSDDDCGGHRCNLTYGKCAWPCAHDCDCVAGFHCEAPACRPN